ncbi:MAG: hypothetical protein IKW00_08915 [Clostridia bacterium]|nr:hypothetical protein [Clostridia bacterium]
MSTTLTSNLIIPEVVSSLIDSNLGDGITLLPLAEQDDTLVGQPGDTLKFPVFAYIGKAAVVAENGQIIPGQLTASMKSVTVQKYAKAISISDEARLSGYGDPVGEGSRQLAHALDHAVDDDLFQCLNDVGVARKCVTGEISADVIADALTLFGEDAEGGKVFLTDAKGLAALRKDPDFVGRGDMGEDLVMHGAKGEVWGCEIVVSNKVRENAQVKEKNYFIVKPGALRLVNKQGALVEIEREPEYMRDNIYASLHCVPYLYDASKVVALTQFTGLQSLTENALKKGFYAEKNEDGKLLITVPEEWSAPNGYRWVCAVNASAEDEGVYGEAYAEGRDIAEETAANGAFCHLLLVDDKNMPVKTLTLAIA